MKKLNKGFTLIELLVVIAIIGILASVVLASLNTARNKGSDAAVKSELAQLRSNGAIFYDTNNQSYGTLATAVCTSPGTNNVFASSTSIITTLNTNANGGAYCTANGASFVITVPLKGGTTWCADPTQVLATAVATTTLATNVVCS